MPACTQCGAENPQGKKFCGTLRTALELYERKENLVMAGRVRELLG
jgi:hypothetical protein